MRVGGQLACRCPPWRLRQIQNTRPGFDNNWRPFRQLSSIRIAFSQRLQDCSLVLFQDSRGGCGVVVKSMRVQRGVHREVREMVVQRLASRSGFQLDDRHADHDIGPHGRFGRVAKRQNISRVILAAILAVQPRAFPQSDKTQRDLGVALQGGSDPTHQRRTRRQARKPGVPLQRQRQPGRDRSARAFDQLARRRVVSATRAATGRAASAACARSSAASYASTMRPTSGCRTTSAAVK